MLRFCGQARRLCDGWTRREVLRAGAVGGLGLALPELLRGNACATPNRGGSFGRAKNCILLFLTGGPPQHDTWDPKPHAPAEIRGEFRPIATSVPGIQIAELFPLLAEQAARYCLVRSITHADTLHTSAGYTMLTGAYHARASANNAADVRPSAKDHPHLGSLVARLLPARPGLPSFVALPEIIKDAAINPFPGQGGGFLGQRYEPFRIDATADHAELIAPALVTPAAIDAARLGDRMALRAALDRRFVHAVPERSFAEIDAFALRAIDLVSSPAARRALEIDREPPDVRTRYGAHLFGRGCLLARRLIEAGVRLATVYWHYEGPDDSPVWDTHWNNFQHLRQRLMPPTDRAVAALLADLHERGLLDETLVICLGEFGRSPKINSFAGRDHWPGVQSIMLAGAGLPSGAVIGASDKFGGAPADLPITPPDLFATFMHLLGIAPDTQLTDLDGRTLAATTGNVVAQLVSEVQ